MERLSAIHSTIKAIEDTLNLHVAINDYTGNFYSFLPVINSFHCNLCCLEVKRTPASNSLCHDFDTGFVPQKLKAARCGILKKCHAGLFEIAYPINNGEVLMGTIFLGPFHVTDPFNVPHYVQGDRDEEGSIDQKFLGDHLPVYSSSHVKNLLVLVNILFRNLEADLLATNQKASAGALSRKGVIDRYLSMNFCKPIKLCDLAKHLALSQSRVSEVIRSLYKASFPDLLNAFRVEHARKLLRSSEFTIEEIAERCGFSNAAYFFKVFKEIARATPKTYRQEHQGKQIEADYV